MYDNKRIMILGFPSASKASLDLISYLYFHNDTKIYNLELELEENIHWKIIYLDMNIQE